MTPFEIKQFLLRKFVEFSQEQLDTFQDQIVNNLPSFQRPMFGQNQCKTWGWIDEGFWEVNYLEAYLHEHTGKIHYMTITKDSNFFNAIADLHGACVAENTYKFLVPLAIEKLSIADVDVSSRFKAYFDNPIRSWLNSEVLPDWGTSPETKVVWYMTFENPPGGFGVPLIATYYDRHFANTDNPATVLEEDKQVYRDFIDMVAWTFRKLKEQGKGFPMRKIALNSLCKNDQYLYLSSVDLHDFRISVNEAVQNQLSHLEEFFNRKYLSKPVEGSTEELLQYAREQWLPLTN